MPDELPFELPGGLAVRHRVVPGRAGRIHLVERGQGPVVLLVHGFPESWYSWRRQLGALADAGYRAVAVDVRGYGRSSRPAAPEDYRMTELVDDVAAVAHALGARQVAVVGHDWGAAIAAHAALLRPDVVAAFAMLSIPFAPRGGVRPSEGFAQLGGSEEFYVSRFQEPGRAEAEIEPDVRGWLRGFFAALSADTMPPAGAPDPHFAAPGQPLRERFPAEVSPAWLGDDDLDVYAAEFERTGMTGALHRYRTLDRDWADLAGVDTSRIAQPCLFVGGALDASTTWLRPAIDALPDVLPGLLGSHLLDGCGHWVQQERPAEVDALLLDWLARCRLGH